MTDATRIERLRARLDRLPAGWVIILAGFVLQVALAGGLLALAFSAGDRVELAVAAVLLVVVVLAGVAALPATLLLWLGRYRRTAAVLSVLVGVGTLVVNEGHPTVWLFPVALFVAAVRAWAGAGLDTADLLRIDPERFDRVEPARSPDRRDGSREGPPGEES